MKKISLTLSLAMLLLAVPARPQGADDKKAHELVAQTIDAMGGSAYLNEKYRSGSGTFYSFSSVGELDNAGLLFWDFVRFPDGYRLEETKKRDVIYIYNGDQGWEVTFKGVAPLRPFEIASRKDVVAYSLDTILRQWAQDPKTILVYEGLNTVDQNQVDSVTFYSPDNKIATLDISRDTHLPARIHWRRDDTQTGGHYDQSVFYANWIRADGIEVAYATQTFQGTHKIQQSNYTEISCKPLPDSLFEQPKKKGH